MSGLPPLPRTLRLFPSRLAIERSVGLAAGECLTLDGCNTFEALLKAIGGPPGWGYCSTLCGRFIVRGLLRRQGGRVVAQSAGSGHGSRFVVTQRAAPQAGA